MLGKDQKKKKVFYIFDHIALWGFWANYKDVIGCSGGELFCSDHRAD